MPDALAPSDLTPRGAGRKFWRQVTRTWDLRPDETILLGECCRMLDELAELRDRDDGHRKRMELRVELRRTLTTLGLTDAADEAAHSDRAEDMLAAARAEREAAASRRASRAAAARWARHRHDAPS